MSSSHNSRRSLWILIGLVIGAVAGVIAQVWFSGDALNAAVTNVIKPIGSIFLRIIFMVVVPLIISAIVLGVVELGDPRRLGRVGLRAIAMTLLLSGLSVVLGLTLVNVFAPGKRIPPEVRDKLVASYTVQAGDKIKAAESAKPLAQTLLDLIPVNPLEESVNAFNPDKANGGLIAVMIFALFIGVAMTMLTPGTDAPLRSLL